MSKPRDMYLQAVAVELIQRRIFVRACADLADRLPRVDADAVEHGFGPDHVAIKHWATFVGGPAIAVQPDDIDV